YFSTLAPLEADATAQRLALERLKERRAHPQIHSAGRGDDLRRFYALFPPADKLTDEVQKLHELARTAGLGPVGLPRDPARPRQLPAVPRIHRPGAEENADRLSRRAAFRAQEGDREPARGAAAPHHLRPAPGRSAMKRTLLALFFLLAACATGPTPIEDARKRFDEGRSDEALAVLQKASRENPQDNYLRVEYHRMRDVVVAQWLAQAEALRQSARFDAAETLYRRVLSHDQANPRATSGLAQVETDRRHAALAAQAEQLVRAGKFREAQDVLRPVLTENPQQKDARRLQRVIDDKLVPPVIVSAALKPASTKPISIELRDVTLRNIFETLQRATGINFIFDR